MVIVHHNIQGRLTLALNPGCEKPNAKRPTKPKFHHEMAPIPQTEMDTQITIDNHIKSLTAP